MQDVLDQDKFTPIFANWLRTSCEFAKFVAEVLGFPLLEGIQGAAETFGELLQNDHRHFSIIAQGRQEVPAR